MTKSELINKFIEVCEVLALNPNGFGDAKEDWKKVEAEQEELRRKIYDRMI